MFWYRCNIYTLNNAVRVSLKALYCYNALSDSA